MKQASIILLLWATTLIVHAAYDAGFDPEGVQPKAIQLLKAADYNGLESLAVMLKKQPYDLLDDHPPLSNFYDAFAVEDTAKQQQWDNRRQELEAWLAAVPESVSARVALARWYLSYGIAAGRLTMPISRIPLRTAAYKRAKAILEGMSTMAIDDPEYYTVAIRLSLQTDGSPARTEDLFKKGKALAREYYPLYREAGNYLLLRTNPVVDDRDRFNKAAADNFPQLKGDALYAYLTRDYLFLYDDVSCGQVHIDYERAKRGFLWRIGGNDPLKWRDEIKLCFMAAVRGDNSTAKKLFLELQDAEDPSIFGGKDIWEKYEKQTGAEAAFEETRASERAGHLAEAEKNLLSYTSDPANYPPLQFFYERHGMETKLRGITRRFEGKTISEICDMDTETTPSDLLLEMAECLPMLGKWDKAEAAASRFDRLNPSTLAGKNILLLCAIHRGDAPLAEAMVKAITNLKSENPGYAEARAVLAGLKNWKEVSLTLKQHVPYPYQGATSIELYFIAEGKADMAKRVVDDALPYCHDSGAESLLESTIYGSVAQGLKSAKLLH